MSQAKEEEEEEEMWLSVSVSPATVHPLRLLSCSSASPRAKLLEVQRCPISYQ